MTNARLPPDNNETSYDGKRPGHGRDLAFPSPERPPPAGDGRSVVPEPPLTIAEVARHYRMSERTVRRRIDDGTLQKELGQGRLVRISVEQLRKLSKDF